MNLFGIEVGTRCVVVAEIGINHNGDLGLALRLIDEAKKAGADAVKFQKRTVDLVYSPEELAKPRESVFGHTNGDQKRGLEFGLEQYDIIDKHCREIGIPWFASCWDKESVKFVDRYDVPAQKVASSLLTNDGLMECIGRSEKAIVCSVGGATTQQIEHALGLLGRERTILLHCIRRYPAPTETLNLRNIITLKHTFGIPVGYSGHEVGLATSVASVVLGACMVERHFTLDRSMWGSDQSSSVEPHGFARMIRDIRACEAALGTELHNG